MAEWNRLLKALSVVLPAGAFGASILLALAAGEASAAPNSSQPTNAPPPTPTSQESVSTRLRAIRAGVSDMTGSASFDPAGDAKATPVWWGNGGWGRWHPGWGNGGGWRNGGWGNGGWHNAGWGNGWHNFWHNW